MSNPPAQNSGDSAHAPGPDPLDPLNITPEQPVQAPKVTAAEEREDDERIARKIAEGKVARYQYKLKSDPELWKKAVKETEREERYRDERMKPFLPGTHAPASPPRSAPSSSPVGYMLDAYEAHGHRIPPEQLLRDYARGPADLEAALAGMTPAQIKTRPSRQQAATGAGSWSPLELVAHLADCDQFLADRIKRTLAYGKAGEIPLLVGVDENKYFAAFDYQARDLAEELALLRTTRSQVTRILEPLTSTPRVWQYQAQHTEAGPMTLHKILFHAAYHIPHHLAYLHKKREAFGLA